MLSLLVFWICSTTQASQKPRLFKQSLIYELSNWTNVLPFDGSFISEGHLNERVKIYFNDPAAPTYKNPEITQFSIGSIIAKAFLKKGLEHPLQSKEILFMRKMSPGYDPENADWAYAVYRKKTDGDFDIRLKGKLQSCIDCHKAQSTHDYIISDLRYREYRGIWGHLKYLFE